MEKELNNEQKKELVVLIAKAVNKLSAMQTSLLT
jgi:hypothetical protein